MHIAVCGEYLLPEETVLSRWHGFDQSSLLL